MLSGVIDLDYQGEIRLAIHSGGKKEYVWNMGEPLELVIPCPVINVNRKLQQHNLSRMVGVAHDKEQRPAEVISEDVGNKELIIEEVSYKY